MSVGFIRDKLEIKFLILYIASRVSEPMPLAELQELTMCDDGIDYFDFAECLNDLVNTEHLRLADERYCITPKGLRNSEICESSLPYSVRIRADKNLGEYQKLLVRRKEKNWFYRKTEPFFEGLNNLYARSLAAFLRRRMVAVPVMLAALIGCAIMWSNVPAEMAPLEDRSSITIRTTGPEGVTYEYMRDYTEDINALADSLMPDAEFITARVSSGSDYAQGPEGARLHADGGGREALQGGAQQDRRPRLRAAAEHLRRTPRRHACAVCAASHQH